MTNRTARPSELAEANSPCPFSTEEIDTICATIRPLFERARGTVISLLLQVGQILQQRYQALVEQYSAAGRTADIHEYVQQVADRLRAQGIVVTDDDLEASLLVAARLDSTALEGLAAKPWVAATHVMTIARVADEGHRQHLVDKVLDGPMTTRQLQNAVKACTAPGGPPVPAAHRRSGRR